MKTSKKPTLIVKGISIATFVTGTDDFISLTDIARNKNSEEPKDVVKNWMRSRATIEFLGIWDQINNPEFKGVEFDTFKIQMRQHTFMQRMSLNKLFHPSCEI